MWDTILDIAKTVGILAALYSVAFWFPKQLKATLDGAIAELKVCVEALGDKLDTLSNEFHELLGEHKINHRR